MLFIVQSKNQPEPIKSMLGGVWLYLHLLLQVTIMTFLIELNLNFAFFFMQVIHMTILTFSCMQVKIMMFWIGFDLIFVFFYMQVVTILFCIVLDLIQLFCM